MNNDETFSVLSKNYLSDKISKNGLFQKDASSDLIITSDTINVVEKENYKSYTIRIKRSEQEYDTENLIIEQKEGVENAYILSYDFDNDWIIDNINGIHTRPKGKVYYTIYETSNLKSRTSFSKSSGSCYNVTISITSPCPCAGHYIISGCYCYQKATSYTTTQLVCDSGGGDNDDGVDMFPTDGGNEGDIGGSGGGGSPTTTDPDGESETQTNLEDMSEFIEVKINSVINNLDLNSTEVDWIFNGDDNNVQKTLDVYDYGSAKRWSVDAIDFGNLAFDVFIDGGEVDIENEIFFDASVPECLENIIFDFIYANMPMSAPVSGVSLIEEVFNALALGNPVERDFVFTYKVEDIPQNGTTTTASYDAGTNKYFIDIIIGSDLVDNGTKLAIAKTVLHESIHGYLRYLNAIYPSYFGTLNGDFSELVQAYMNYNNLGMAHHTYMAEIVEEMGSNLSAFMQTYYNYPAGSGDYYEAVCWSGLTHFSESEFNPVFTNNYPNTEDQQHIIKIFNTENGTQTIPEYSPIIDNNCE